MKNDSTKSVLAFSGAALALLPAVDLSATIIVDDVPKQRVSNGTVVLIPNLPLVREGIKFRVRNSAGGAYYSIGAYGTGASCSVVQSGVRTLARLTYGDAIGPGANWDVNGKVSDYYFGSPWENTYCSKYIGFRVLKADTRKDLYYGWAELLIQDGNPGPNLFTIVRWAYNDVPNEGLLAGSTTPVPVTMTHVDAALLAPDHARVNWSTASEQANQGWAVERSSDGATWEEIGFVPGVGDSHEPRDYYFDDRDLRGLAEAYYRLEQRDYDGTSERSAVVYVEVSEGQPAVAELRSNILAAGRAARLLYVESSTAWTLHDVRGAIMAEGRGPRVPTDGLSAGVYYLSVGREHLELTIVE